MQAPVVPLSLGVKDLSMSKTLEFYFDLVSPASYLAWTQLPELCAQTGARLIYKPMLLSAVLQATGNTPPLAVPAKGRYVMHDLLRHARRYGVELRLNPHFPFNSLTLMRLLIAIQLHQPERFEAAMCSLFPAFWAQGENLNDPSTLHARLNSAGFDAQHWLACATTPEVKEALKANTDEAVRRGAFGAPSLFVGDELFFGQDRLEFVREALLAQG